MSKTIIVGGYGPGISSAVAEKFGGGGRYGRARGAQMERLADGVKALTAKGIKAAAFRPTRRTEGGEGASRQGARVTRPDHRLQWTANGGSGDVTTASDARCGRLDMRFSGLVAAVPAPRTEKEGGRSLHERRDRPVHQRLTVGGRAREWASRSQLGEHKLVRPSRRRAERATAST